VLGLDRFVSCASFNSVKKFLAPTLLAFALFSLSFATPALAAEDVEEQLLPTSPLYLLVKVKEAVQQFLTFDQAAKAELLDEFTEQRIKEMDYAAFSDDDDALELSLDRYQVQKTRALEHAEGANDSVVVERIRERTREQQRVMTQMQLTVEGSEGVQQHIVETQMDIAEETERVVEVVISVDEAVKVVNETRYIWLDPNADADGSLPSLPDKMSQWEYAPGTDGRDENGRMVEVTFAPGTTAGGEAGNKVGIEWAPGTEGAGEATVTYDGGPKMVIQDMGRGGGGGGRTDSVEVEIAE